MITNKNVISSARMGGRVKRYHTWPTLTEQTVGEHTFNTLRIYYEVFGDLPSEVALYLLYHDTPEVGTGDPPHQVKRDNPAMKAAYDELEDAVLTLQIGSSRADRVLGQVDDLQRVRMKAADRLEMAEFASFEMALGNKFAAPIMENVRVALDSLELSKRDRSAVDDFLSLEVGRWD